MAALSSAQMLKSAFLIVIATTTAACSDMCSNTVISKVDAPDRERSAVLFLRDCGATTGFSTQISILKPGAPLQGGGNVFRADDDHGAAIAGDWGGPWADIEWISARHLHVKYAKNSRVLQQESDVEGVRVTFASEGSEPALSNQEK